MEFKCARAIMDSKAINRLTKLSTIISFMLICYSLLLVANAPTTGYEISIYFSTPTIFWFAIIFSLLNGLFLLASGLYGKTGKMPMVGLFQILFCNILVISLYALRGYVLYFGREDVSSYVGMAKDISEFGNFGSNLYPITSILISLLNQITGIDNITISKYLSSIFFIIYILSIYCWSKSLIPDRKFVLCSMISCMPIFFAWFSTSIYHQVLSVFTLPFFFYLLQRNSDYRFKLFTIIYLIIYPFFHPIIGIVVILYMTVLFTLEKFNLFERTKNVSSTLLLLSFSALVAWFIQQYGLLRNAKTILYQLIGLLDTPTTLDHTLYIFNKLGVTTAIKVLGLMIIDEIVFCLFSLIVIHKIVLRKEPSPVQKLSKISICFIIGNLFLLILFFSTVTHLPDRLINLNFNMMLTPPLVGYLLYTFFLNNKKNKAILSMSLIFISAVTAIFTLYPSPITMSPNKQITISDVRGMTWLIIQKNPEIKTADIRSQIFRFADLIYGLDFRGQRKDLYHPYDPPPNFGLTNDETFPIDEDRYLVITESDIKPYIMELWKDLEPEFEVEDFIKINSCTNVDKIYENGEFRSYFVHKND